MRIKLQSFEVTRRAIGSYLPLLTRRLLFKSGDGVLLRQRNNLWIQNIFVGYNSVPVLCKRFISTTNNELNEKIIDLNSKIIHSNLNNNELKSQKKIDIDSIQGTLDYGEDGLYIFSCKCNVCNSKIVKKFSKKAYNEGIVIVRCDNCNNYHLVSDKLGWFEDNKDGFNIFKFLKNKEISIS